VVGSRAALGFDPASVALFVYLIADGLTSLYSRLDPFGLFQGLHLARPMPLVREYFPPPKPPRASVSHHLHHRRRMALGGGMGGCLFDVTGLVPRPPSNHCIAWNCSERAAISIGC